VRSCKMESNEPHLRKRSRRAEVLNITPCLIRQVVQRRTRARFTQERRGLQVGWKSDLIEGANGSGETGNHGARSLA